MFIIVFEHQQYDNSYSEWCVILLSFIILFYLEITRKTITYSYPFCKTYKNFRIFIETLQNWKRINFIFLNKYIFRNVDAQCAE